ncbi:MAG: type II toxin-antitoxin system VapC family toxin [Ferrovibrio sp.]
MILDSSVLIAILRGEPDALFYIEAVADAADLRMSAANFLETAIVVDASRHPTSSRSLDDFVARHKIVIEPVTETQARIAREAYRDFGKGSGHPAQLNFGDCFAYALAKDLGEPLLFKGDDFRHTDVRPAGG